MCIYILVYVCIFIWCEGWKSFLRFPPPRVVNFLSIVGGRFASTNVVCGSRPGVGNSGGF